MLLLPKDRKLAESFQRVFEAGGAQAFIYGEVEVKDYSIFTHAFADDRNHPALDQIKKSGLAPMRMNYVADYLRGKETNKKYIL